MPKQYFRNMIAYERYDKYFVSLKKNQIPKWDMEYTKEYTMFKKANQKFKKNCFLKNI